LAAYGDARLAQRYREFLAKAPDALRLSVAKGYHKLLAIKDEYEVARLHLSSLEKAKAEFEGDLRPRFHLAPPFLPGKDAAGRPRKRSFGPWIIPVFRALAALKPLRGGWLDPFRFAPERRMERALIAEYEADLSAVFANYTPKTLALAKELAELPLTIRGFGPVKEANAAKAALRRAEILAQLQDGGTGGALAME
jgi:indolepyruvate ferredoxin oxidoreductase